jgi:PhnB protein
MPERAFFSVLTPDPGRVAAWYRDLLGYDTVFDSDWFVQLRDPRHELLELGFLRRDHEIVPERSRAAGTGGMLTFVVDDVDATHRWALDAGLEVLEPPRNLFYGQRRMLLLDPDGQLVDVSSECPPDPEWLASLTG